MFFFLCLQPELIKAYVENGEGLDRAGGFAIQVSLFFFFFFFFGFKEWWFLVGLGLA
jgi:predicted house-cleaning NTP pyrophosphatase (Maf/HAM1 superfamily)